MYSGPERRKIDWRTVIVAILSAILAALGTGSTTVALRGCGQVQPPPPEPPGPPTPPPPTPTPTDPVQAVGKLILQGAFCSATVVGPRRDDGRWNIVTASHCYGKANPGTRSTFITRKGTSVPVTMIAIDRTADIAICVTDERYEQLDNIPVADGTPVGGTGIFHGGFGQDKPGNIEKGQVVNGPDNRQQVHYRLSVSPGDSGGGIIVDGSGRLLSPVCCTTCLGCPGDVWGGSPERIRAMLARPTEFLDLPPAVMPPPPKD